ncbi:alpha/beta hydrolase domain-containing protein [Nocardioides solisilvae]|uniref:alpha/beta hydrolase domain-containing protein n=1 Tax=Nocardioides solisilvae TaxID=1542435 RepID=UPI000D74B5E6|nr:alpha/beta hydrolase domain-containing protein [Nocardioides solisilvae]
MLVRARRLAGVLTTFASLWALLVPTPEVAPAPAGTPQASVAHLSAPRGYVESEHVLAGRASAYEAVGTWGADGRWHARAVGERTPYRTRVIVNRPADPRRFNGTVYVEWLNVSSGIDIAPSFAQARDQILSSGAAWVGVSAQRAGVEAAKRIDPARYGSLEVPGDAFSYDIYSQAGKAVRARARQLLGGLRPHRVIATGESQSAFRLTTYVNAFSRTTGVFDGFLVHSRFAPAAPLGEGLMGPVSPRIREDVAVPVLQLQTESDLGGWEAVRQPDRGNVHTWEVAGAAHADVHTLESSAGTDLDPESAAARMGCARPINDFPFRYAADAAYAALERWVRTGRRPASAPPLEIVDDWLQRDADGIVRGGLRLPDVEVPLAVHSGQGNYALNGGFFCLLFGTTVPLPAERLAALHPSVDAYVEAYTAAADAALRAGFMTRSDRDAAVASARARAEAVLVP